MTLIFEGQLSLDTMATHVPHYFDVPEGTQTVKLRFTHDPQHPGVGDIPHQLSISVYGPNGARGTRHNNADQNPIISTNWASPGYLKGEIEAGNWCVEIDVHRVLAPGLVNYRIEVDLQDAPVAKPSETIVPEAGQKRRGPGWYQGDLHSHTFHSDGGFSPAEHLAVMLDRGHDFVALTDHNTVSAIPELKARAGDAITIIGGEELTTYNGHALVLGTEEWCEWRVKDGSTMSGLASGYLADGKLYVIAHPKSEGHPFCTGCRWAFSDMMPGPARHVEIWNSAWALRNELGLQNFYCWLNEGYRMRATSGTDTHRFPPNGARLAHLMVKAEDNTQTDILAAIKQGHCYVSGGPRVSLNISSGALTAEMGDLLPAGSLVLECNWQSAVDIDGNALILRLVHKGEAIEEWDTSDTNSARFETESHAGDWFTFEMRDAKNELYALTNPVFIGDEGTWR